MQEDIRGLAKAAECGDETPRATDRRRLFLARALRRSRELLPAVGNGCRRRTQRECGQSGLPGGRGAAGQGLRGPPERAAGAGTCARARRALRRWHGAGAECRRSRPRRRLPPQRARRGVEDRGLELSPYSCNACACRQARVVNATWLGPDDDGALDFCVGAPANGITLDGWLSPVV